MKAATPGPLARHEPGTAKAWPSDLLPPPFAGGARPGLLDVLRPLVEGPKPGRDLVVLVDGLGADLLRDHRAFTPTLRRLEAQTQRIRTVAPSTTSSAMVSLHTGAAPIEHGVLGYLTYDPQTGRSLNQISGATGTDPRGWMPLPTLVGSGSRRAVQVGPSRHAASHLSDVAYRGWEFRGHGRSDRVDVVRAALRRAGADGLVHLHVDDIDHAGHRHGVDSEQWRDALAEVDALIGTLLRRLPRGTRIHLTADHGMVDTSPELTTDLADHPRLLRLIHEVSGEARALALHAVRGDGAAEELAAELEALLGERALVLRREDILASALLGPVGAEVTERVSGRIPDLLVLSRGRWSVDDFSRRPDSARQMIGVHGSLTAAESWVPLLHTEV